MLFMRAVAALVLSCLVVQAYADDVPEYDLVIRGCERMLRSKMAAS
jgi:hypothetical protein